MRTIRRLFGELLGFVSISVFLLGAASAQAAVFGRPGTVTTLTGPFGNVEVNSVRDDPSLTGYVDPGGIIHTGVSPIPVTRVQYDVRNASFDDGITAFVVTYQPGVTVIAAGNAQSLLFSGGGPSHPFGGTNFSVLFSAGFGTYIDPGSEWTIDYQPTFIAWRYHGNVPFAPGTGTGYSFPPQAADTFQIDFARGTVIGLEPGAAIGQGSTFAFGQVLSASAVPEPGSYAMLGIGLVLLGAAARRRLRD